MLSILKACEDQNYPAEVSLVLSNRPDAQGLVHAKERGIPTETVDHKAFDTREDFENEIQSRLQNYNLNLIVLAGFMRILTASFVEKWPEKIINIHPSLLPDYKGQNTHQRVLDDGKSETGCTVHYVTPDLDSGPTIAQARIPVLDGDTVETLSTRLLEHEHKIYPEAIRIIATSKSQIK